MPNSKLSGPGRGQQGEELLNERVRCQMDGCHQELTGQLQRPVRRSQTCYTMRAAPIECPASCRSQKDHFVEFSRLTDLTLSVIANAAQINLRKPHMQNLRTRHVSKKVTKFNIPEERFSEAAQRVRDGIAAADLGGGVVKERIARAGEGKSGGFRTLCCCGTTVS